MSESTLPQSWLLVTLNDIADWSSGGTPSRSVSSFYNGNIPWLKTGELGEKYVYDSEEKITQAGVENSSAKVFPKGSIALAMYGATIGKLSILAIDASTNQACAVAAPIAEVVDTLFLYYFLLSQRQAFIDEGKGGAQPNISQGLIKAWPFPLPPRNEQTRIVEKLEEIFSDLDAGVAELKAAQKKLVQYRQSLLKAAVEGALTAAWRVNQMDEGEFVEVEKKKGTLLQFSIEEFLYRNKLTLRPPKPGEDTFMRYRYIRKQPETGEALLARILAERRRRWEEKQLAKFAAQGKTPPKDWQTKYPEPVQPDTSDLPELPEGWTWASVDQLSEIQGGIQKQPSRAPVTNKYPFLRVANVARGKLRLDEIHEIELFPGELERLALQRGDILIVEGNGSLTEIGRCALWDGSIENAVHQNHLIRARPLLMRSEFLETWLNSARGIERMSKLAATTSGLYTLSVSKIAKIPVPLPPLEEQVYAIEFLHKALEEQERQEQAVEFGLKQSEAQRKNILKAAFSGQLLAQDPNDEPASVLLERIRAQREERALQPKPRKAKVSKQEVQILMTKLVDVLAEAGDWITAEEAFRRCGVADGTSTERIEELYAELRELVKAEPKRLEVARKGNSDRLKLIAKAA